MENESQHLTSLYSRVPLDQGQRQIRLLWLAPGQSRDELRGKLVVTSMDSMPAYDALSNTWGASTMVPQPSISIEHEWHISLTDNLYKALKRLRRRFQKRVLWIDAICINQGNASERSHQVSIMGQIYKSARRVCIWLGDTPDGSALTRLRLRLTPFWVLALTSRRLRRRSATFQDYVFGKTLTRLPRKWWLFGAEAVAEAIGAALNDASPPWHTRLWVFQELNNAQRLLWCFGPFEKALGPQRFVEACKGAQLCSNNVLDRALTTLLNRFATDLEDMSKQVWWNDNDESVQGMPPTLRTNAINTQNLAAKDARDKVYALLSISTPDEAAVIAPDYQRTIAQVYAEATFASIVGSNSFDIFRHIELEAPRLEGLPSWAADFTRLRRIDLKYVDFVAMDMAVPSNMEVPLPNIQLRDSSKSLHFNAVLFDDIVQSVPMLLWEEDHVAVSSKNDLKNALIHLAQLYRSQMSDNRERKAYTAYAQYIGTRRVVARDWHGSSDVLERLFQDVSGDDDSPHGPPDYALWRSVQWWSLYVGPTRMRADLDPKGSRSSMQLHGFYDYLQCIAARDGRLFTTTAGFLGISAGEILEHDVVALVNGCFLPLLLRPRTSGGYIFRGVAFVGELLCGQLEDIWTANGIRTQEIVLR